MGRLTLNVLLSFAQFEREVTGERIRDKIAASKKNGMWMGGNVPLGYDANERTLILNPAEAKTVRRIFALIVSSAACAGSKKRPTASGSGPSAARRLAAPNAAANPSRAGTSTNCSGTRSTAVKLRTRAS